MKKIIDFMVAAYTLITPEQYGEKRVEAGIKALNILLIPNGLSLLFCFAPLFHNFAQIENPIVSTICWAIIPGLVIGFSVIKYLETHYLGKYEYIKAQYGAIPKIIMIFVVVFHFLISLFLFCYCATFLL